jgi:15-cis-phytoene synthase
MSVQSTHWENHLLAMAYEALENPSPFQHSDFSNQVLLDHAYTCCDQITHHHSRTFFMASGLLPEEKRRAIRALYAFCRTSDDLVDCSDGDAAFNLENWRRRMVYPHFDDQDPVVLAWTDTRHNFQIPWRYIDQLITGVARDLHHSSYETFNDLATYCYGVACTVGLMSMHIIGFTGEQALPYAIRLGVALQLTNILRDVGEDWRAGRVYLPKEEMDAFGLITSDLAAGVVDDRWRAFMRFQVERNRKLFAEAMPGLALLDPEGRFAIAAAAELYQAILVDIEAHDYDVFHRRAHINGLGKLFRLPAIWWRSRNGYSLVPGIEPSTPGSDL